MTPSSIESIAFIGGGNMSSAIIGGLIDQGRPASSIVVVEPFDGAREALARRGVLTLAQAGPALSHAALVVWAVKPQVFREAAAPCGPHIAHAVQLSVMAGIRSEAIAQATGAPRVVRAMPNTPALIGRGIAGLYARPAVVQADRVLVGQVLAPTGECVWVDDEADLDAVTAVSGSGPAYVYYVLEALVEAAVEMGLDESQGRRLAVATFAGATELARRSQEPLSVLRERVTSKGGTTHAAISSLEADAVKASFVKALQAAQRRADELGREFG